MGFSLNLVEGFGSPFQVVHQQTVDVAPGTTHRVVNTVRKLLFVLYGEGRHRVTGWNGVGGDVCLRPGDILALPNRCEQHYSGVAPGHSCRLQVVRLSFAPESLPVLGIGTATVTRLPAEGDDLCTWADYALREPRYIHAASDTAITETLLHLRREMEGHAPGYRARIHSLCAGLTVLFARATIPQTRGDVATQGDASDVSGYHVGKIKTYLRDRLRHPVTLGEVAAFVRLSEEHVARLFKSATGLTVLEYLRRLRIEEAKSRLAATSDNLSEIAHYTGWASLTVFSRNFGRETGITPSEFRRSIARQIG